MKIIVIILSLMAVLVSVVGCEQDAVRSPLDNSTYRYEVIQKDNEDIYSIITQRLDGRERSLQVHGKVRSMVISGSGDTLAITYYRTTGLNPYGAISCDSAYTAGFIDTKTFKLTHEWTISPPNIPVTTQPDQYKRKIWIRRMALSDDGKMLATYYQKELPKQFPLTAIALWDVKTGKAIKEYFFPPIPKSLKEQGYYNDDANDIVFSADNQWIAIAGCWNKSKEIVKPGNGYILIWKVSDDNKITLKPHPHPLVGNLCFDHTGTRLACCDLVRAYASETQVHVWNIPEKKVLYSQKIKNAVVDVTRSADNRYFKVRLKDAPDVLIKIETTSSKESHADK